MFMMLAFRRSVISKKQRGIDPPPSPPPRPMHTLAESHVTTHFKVPSNSSLGYEKAAPISDLSPLRKKLSWKKNSSSISSNTHKTTVPSTNEQSTASNLATKTCVTTAGAY